MGATRERMIKEMDLRGLALATKESYLTCCRVYVAYFGPRQVCGDPVADAHGGLPFCPARAGASSS